MTIITRSCARLVRLGQSVLLALFVAPMVHAAAPAGSELDAGRGRRTVTLVNRDSGGNPTIRFDVDGNAVDAHDGQIQRFGSTYYLYGTSYGCGYEWNFPGAPFCGFVSYSSPDLVHWTPRGPLFDASTPTWQKRCDGGTYGCYRPHVVFNPKTRQYVLWINSYDNGVGYHVFTSPSPTHGFKEVKVPDLAAPEGPPGGVNYGDHQVFVDHDGIAYLAFTDWTRRGDIIVERLDDTYTTGTGDWTRTNLRSTEAPTIFKRGSAYYLTYSDPNRGYTTTGTGYVTAPTPLGPWSGTATPAAAWSVSDGVLNLWGDNIGLSREGEEWRDYSFEAKVTPKRVAASDYVKVGLVVRASAAGGYQWLIGNNPQAGATGGNLIKLVPGQPATVVKLPMPIVAGQVYDVKITVSASRVETWIDGRLVDTTEASASDRGRIGFRGSQGDGVEASVDDVTVTAADGTVLLSDNFSGGLEKWDRPAPTITGTNITTTSCGGQPADVLPLETGSGTVYLYQSDVWMDAKANEALAKHYWQPLRFNGDGSIRPIECGRSYDVTVPVGLNATRERFQQMGTGDAGYRTHWDVAGGLARAQEITVPTDGRLRSVRFTTFQSGHPNAPLVLDLRRTGADGVGATVGSVEISADQVSWAARWAELKLDRPLPVHAGDRFALVVRSATTQGAYGIAYSDTTPYAGGRALISHDAGRTWTVEAGRTLHAEADVVMSPRRRLPR